VRTLTRAYGQGLWEGRAVLAYTILLSLTLFIVAPFLMIALRSVGKGWFGKLWLPPQLTLEWYRWAIEVGNIPEVLQNTVVIGVIAVAISTVIGLFTGWAFGRRRLPGKELVLALFLLPLMIPSITYALGVARIFYALGLVDTHFGVALAHVAVCAPYAIMVLSATFEGLDERVLEAASVCGAGPVRRFFHAGADLSRGRRRLLGDHQRDGCPHGRAVAPHPCAGPAACAARAAGRRLQGGVTWRTR